MEKNQQENQRNSRVKNVPGTEVKRKNVSSMANSTFTNVATCSRPRVSMAPFEFQQPRTLFPKNRNSTWRQSRIPHQMLLDASKEAEAKSKDIELQLLYNTYLQDIMIEHITKKKSEEMKNTIVRRLASIDEECRHAEEKLKKLRIREKDITHLSNIQTELDTQIIEINEVSGTDDIDTFNEIIHYLITILEPLDRLQCNNMILPEKAEEWSELREAFKKCGDTLERIGNSINSNTEMYKATYSGIEDFTTIYNDIENCQKKFNEALTNLQKLVLKYGLYSLK